MGFSVKIILPSLTNGEGKISKLLIFFCTTTNLNLIHMNSKKYCMYRVVIKESEN